MSVLFIFIYPELSFNLLTIINMEGTRIREKTGKEKGKSRR